MPESEAYVRPARREEIPDVLDLWREAEARRGATDDRPSLEALLDRDPDSLLVAELDRRIIGSLIAAWDGWRGNMYRLAVRHEHRRRRIALRLVEEGERRLRDKGALRISALVASEDRSALAVWRAAGYERDSPTGRYVKSLRSARISENKT